MSVRYHNCRLWMIVYAILLAMAEVAFCAFPEANGPSRPLIVRGDATYPPFEFIDDDGQPNGFTIDLLKAIASNSGVRLEIHLGPWDEVRRELEAGKIDVLSGMLYSLERDRVVDFSIPHSVVRYSIFVREDSRIRTISDLAGRSALVQRGDIMGDYVRQNVPSIVVIQRESPLLALQDLAAGGHDCAVLSEMQGKYIIEKYNLDNLRKVDVELTSQENCFAVRQGDGELKAILDQGLNVLKATGEYDRIFNKWFADLREADSSPGLARTVRYLMWVIIPLVVLLGGSVLWSRALRKQVSQRTHQLKEELIERKRAQEAFQQSEARYRSLARISPVAILRSDPEGACVYANETWCKLTGKALPETMGKGWLDAIHAEDRSRVELQWGRFIQQRAGIALEFRLSSKEDHETCVLAKAVPERALDGQLIGFVVTMTDITDRLNAEKERTRLEEQIREAQKLESLGVLAGGIAHDFNNLLVAILGNSDLTLMDLPQDSKVREYVREIKKAAMRASELTNQMLAYSGRGKFVVKPTDINSLASEIGRLMAGSISKDISLQYRLGQPPPHVDGDGVQLRQVVMNLLTNAAEAIEGHTGTITISTGLMQLNREYLSKVVVGKELPEGQYAFLEISDTGCGLASEAQARMFEPFFTTKFTGRGLGLAAVLGIVRGHHGAIKVSSTPGQGTAVRVLLPVSRKVRMVPAKARHVHIPDVGHGETVLVIDDEQPVRDIAQGILTRKGYNVLTAASGTDGLELFREKCAEIALVLLDLNMPDLDGAEVFDQIREKCPQSKVILLSGYSEEEATDRFAGKGLAGFIQKPFELAEFVQRIQKVLGSKPSGVSTGYSSEEEQT